MYQLSKFLVAGIVLILLCIVSYYLLLPILGIAVVMTGAAWGMVLATIAIFSIICLLFLIVPGILIILLSLFSLGWLILAIVLFPFLFPIVIPVFIILLVIGLHRHKKPANIK